MGQFEFFMTFYGLLLGLAVAELLLGFGNVLRARRQPNWGLAHPPRRGSWCSFRSSSPSLTLGRNLQRVSIDFSGVTIPSLIGVSFFAAAILAVPRDADEWPDLDTYFMGRRRFVLGAIIVTIVLNMLA